MNRNHSYADLSGLRDGGWTFQLSHHLGIGYWKDPVTQREYQTAEALRIQQRRQSKV